MSKIKVFLVDDSAVVRQVLTEMLGRAASIEVIGAAPDPVFAEPRMQKDWPDVIVLDIEMPRVDGLTFLRKIMSERPTPVVMCSTLTVEGSSASLEALRAGAVEVVAKPKANLKSSMSASSRELIGAVRTAARANLGNLNRRIRTPVPNEPKLNADAILTKTIRRHSKTARQVVAIGTSTGGTQALEQVLPSLPGDSLPLLVVQHMPEKFTGAFASRLDSLCQVQVKEASDGDEVVDGRVLIAPGGRHMILDAHGGGMKVRIKQGPPVSRHRPSVDVLFRSVANAAGGRALGIIMTGMGDDGASGMKELRDSGAHTLAQNKETCVIYGMPGAAVQQGGVDREVPLEAIPVEIARFARPD